MLLKTDSSVYPVLPLRDMVVFPKMIVPLFVGREKSIKALEFAQKNSSVIILATQKKAAKEDPKEQDIYHVGTMGNILQMLKLPDGTVKVLVEGLDRVKIEHFSTSGAFIEASVEPMAETDENTEELEALARVTISEFKEYVETSKRISPDVVTAVHQIEDLSKLVDTIASHLTLKVEDKQSLLEAKGLKERFEKLIALINAELSMMELKTKSRHASKSRWRKTKKNII